jgi:hypothetical protein
MYIYTGTYRLHPFILYLNSPLLAEFFSLSFIHYVHEAIHVLTLLALLINSRYSRYSLYSRSSRYSLTSTYSTYNVCVCVCVCVCVFSDPYGQTHQANLPHVHLAHLYT